MGNAGFQQNSRILSDIKIAYKEQTAIGTPETTNFAKYFNALSADFKFNPTDLEFLGTQGAQFKRKDAVKRVDQNPTVELTTFVSHDLLDAFLESLTAGTPLTPAAIRTYVWAKRFSTTKRYTVCGWDHMAISGLASGDRYRVYDAVCTKLNLESATGEALIAKILMAGRTFDRAAEEAPADKVVDIWDFMAHAGTYCYYRKLTEEGDAEPSEFSNWLFTDEKLGYNCDADGKVYATVVFDDPGSTLTLYKDAGKTIPVATCVMPAVADDYVLTPNATWPLNGSFTLDVAVPTAPGAVILTLPIKLAVSKIGIEIDTPYNAYIANADRPVDHIRHGWMIAKVTLEGLLGDETNYILAKALTTDETLTFEEITVRWLDKSSNYLELTLQNVLFKADGRVLDNSEDVTAFSMTGEVYITTTTTIDPVAADDPVQIKAFDYTA